MDDFTKSRLRAIAFNLAVAVYCFLIGVWTLADAKYGLATLNFSIAVLNVSVAAFNYRSMQKLRLSLGLDPFSIRKIKVPTWAYNFYTKHLCK